MKKGVGSVIAGAVLALLGAPLTLLFGFGLIGFHIDAAGNAVGYGSLIALICAVAVMFLVGIVLAVRGIVKLKKQK